MLPPRPLRSSSIALLSALLTTPAASHTTRAEPDPAEMDPADTPGPSPTPDAARGERPPASLTAPSVPGDRYPLPPRRGALAGAPHRQPPKREAAPRPTPLTDDPDRAAMRMAKAEAKRARRAAQRRAHAPTA